jgi:predicted esterase
MNILKKSAAVLAAALCLLSGGSLHAQETYKPAGTYRFAVKDGTELFLDEYPASAGSVTSVDGKAKPAIVFVFGGGFFSGQRSAKSYLKWFKMLNDEGYTLLTIDYRLGLKGVKTKGGIGSVKQFYHAVTIASEDLFSAVKYIIDNAATLDVDPDNLVISGSSAGAMTVLQSDWLLSNGKATEALPEGFRFAGVMSFSGAILSREGMPGYSQTPSPTAFFHGTADKVVNYKKMKVFNWAFAGSDKLVKIFKKNGYTYNIYRYQDHTHEIADAMAETFADQIRFLETNVTGKVARNVDCTIDDPQIPEPQGSANRKELYSKN